MAGSLRRWVGEVEKRRVVGIEVVDLLCRIRGIDRGRTVLSMSRWKSAELMRW